MGHPDSDAARCFEKVGRSSQHNCPVEGGHGVDTIVAPKTQALINNGPDDETVKLERALGVGVKCRFGYGQESAVLGILTHWAASACAVFAQHKKPAIRQPVQGEEIDNRGRIGFIGFGVTRNNNVFEGCVGQENFANMAYGQTRFLSLTSFGCDEAWLLAVAKRTLLSP